MRTFVIEGKPLEEVTIKVKGQSLTLTEGVEVTVIVVVASQQSVQRTANAARVCGECGEPFEFCAMGHYDVEKARRG